MPISEEEYYIAGGNGGGEPEERISWSSKKVENLMIAIDEGYKPKGGTPFYEGNPIIRKGNIVYDYTEEEIQELSRCARDIVYFANNYCTVMTDSGLQTIELRDYQEDMLQCYMDNRFSIVLASRQIGKTICSSIFIAHYLLFSVDKNVLILSNKGATTREIVDKAKTILENVPFFMKPGVLKNDVFNMKFDNGCRLIAQSTTKKAGIGFTIHLLFLDEFAHIHANFVESFFENVYPTLSSSQVSRIIITSTPNGLNKFYEIYNRAYLELNEFKAFRVDWWQVPGRDDVWMKKEIADLGTEEAFNRQYGNSFIESSSLLLGPREIKKLELAKKDFISEDYEELDDTEVPYRNLMLWHPEFDFDETQDDDAYWLFSVDIAEGNGGDFSIINIFKIEPMDVADFKYVKSPGTFQDFYRIRQVAIFRSNDTGIEEFAKILYVLAFDIFNPENVKMVIEWNTFGGELIKRLQTVFPHRNEFDEEIVVKFKHRNDAKVYKYGLKIKTDNKSIFCQNFKKFVQQNKIIFDFKENVNEALSFGLNHLGRYKAQAGHDDMIMSCINASEFFITLDFSDYVEELHDTADPKFVRAVDEVLDQYIRKTGDGQLNYDLYDLLG